MGPSTVTFYLNPEFWKDERDIGTIVLYVDDSNLIELSHIAESYLNTTVSALKLSEALPSDVHPQLQGHVKFSVFMHVGDGVEKLIGWFDRKPACWPNGVWKKLRHGFIYEPFSDDPIGNLRDITAKKNSIGNDS